MILKYADWLSGAEQEIRQLNTGQQFLLSDLFQGYRWKQLKMLGDIRGISYVYPMLYRFGIIEVPTEIANQMIGKNPKMKKK